MWEPLSDTQVVILAQMCITFTLFHKPEEDHTIRMYLYKTKRLNSCVLNRENYLRTVSIHYFLWSTSYFYLHKALHESWCERIIFNMSDISPFLGNCTDRQKLYARGHLVFSSGGFTRGCWREIQHTVQNTGEVVSCWDLPLYQVYCLSYINYIISPYATQMFSPLILIITHYIS